MANEIITQLNGGVALTAPATGDVMPITDVSDTTEAASGTTKPITLANLFKIIPTVICLACSDEGTALVAATNVVKFRMPHAMTLTSVRASLTTAASSGTFTVDINESGTTILSTKITIDATEKTSTTAAASVISDTSLADDAEISIDIDDDAAGDATGLKVYLIGNRA